MGSFTSSLSSISCISSGSGISCFGLASGNGWALELLDGITESVFGGGDDLEKKNSET